MEIDFLDFLVNRLMINNGEIKNSEHVCVYITVYRILPLILNSKQLIKNYYS